MGIYFIKSTDLPKELTDRSAQMRAETGPIIIQKAKKISLPNQGLKESSKSATASINIAKLAELNLMKKAAQIKLYNEEIDKLTLTITTLEQEIKFNNDKNIEIQKTIETHLVSLQILQEKVVSLS